MMVAIALCSPSALLLDVPLGLIIICREMKLTDGVSRSMLPNANLA
jgi:hypothetical protein